jgi:hypothetical protein
MTITRDYKHEHQLRKKNRKRLVADIDKEKAQALENMLKSENMTFSNWINNKINDFIKEA